MCSFHFLRIPFHIPSPTKYTTNIDDVWISLIDKANARVRILSPTPILLPWLYAAPVSKHGEYGTGTHVRREKATSFSKGLQRIIKLVKVHHNATQRKHFLSKEEIPSSSNPCPIVCPILPFTTPERKDPFEKSPSFPRTNWTFVKRLCPLSQGAKWGIRSVEKR